MLAKKFVPYTGTGIIVGQSGAGKSFIMAHMAVRLAHCQDVFGFKIKENVASIVLAAEGQADINARIYAARKAEGIDKPIDIGWIKNVLQNPICAHKPFIENILYDF